MDWAQDTQLTGARWCPLLGRKDALWEGTIVDTNTLRKKKINNEALNNNSKINVQI